MAKRKKAARKRAASGDVSVSKGAMCDMHKGCSRCWGWVLLVVGLVFLLEDLGFVDLLGIQWFTVAFLVIGLMKLCYGYRCK